MSSVMSDPPIGYNIGEYRAVSPLPAPEYYAEADVSDNKTGIKMIMTVSGEDMHKLGGVVVEVWDHVVGQGSSGSKRRAYHAAFTETERKKIGSWKAKYWAWELRSGYPFKGVAMTVQTYDLLVRAANFFATV